MRAGAALGRSRADSSCLPLAAAGQKAAEHTEGKCQDVDDRGDYFAECAVRTPCHVFLLCKSAFPHTRVPVSMRIYGFA